MNMNGKTVLITGASSGIGLEASVKLARMGAHVVMVARSRKKGESVLEDIKQRSGSGAVELLLCDFSSQASIRALAAEFRSKYSRLDVLIDNAGGVNSGRRTTVDGLEQTFAVNHLGYFLLTTLLLDMLERSAPSRVVITASRAHLRGDLEFDNLQFEKGGYSIMRAYSRSKLCNVLFSNELARRMASKGVTVNCLHPGVVATNIWGGPLPSLLGKAVGWVLKPFMITPEQGGDRIVYLAASPEVEGKTGGYYDKDRLVEQAPLAREANVAKRLWDVSAELVADRK